VSEASIRNPLSWCPPEQTGGPNPDPSSFRQVIELTSRVRQLGDLHGITVLDHVIVASNGFVSLADRGGSSLAIASQRA
jgi:hypothetical protein